MLRGSKGIQGGWGVWGVQVWMGSEVLERFGCSVGGQSLGAWRLGCLGCLGGAMFGGSGSLGVFWGVGCLGSWGRVGGSVFEGLGSWGL